jgi:hypothetical protein
MAYVIRIDGLAGGRSPFDGEYLLEYDPERDGRDPQGAPMIAHIVTTAKLEEALRFDSGTDATECWRQVCKRNPTRPDGQPNRPLSAFTVTIAPEEKM